MKLTLILLFALSFFSCATYNLTPLPSDDIEIMQSRGFSIPVYNSMKFGMVIAPEFHENEIMIKINIMNKSEEVAIVEDTDFFIEESADGVIWRSLKVYTSKEYYSKEKNEYIAGAMIMVLGAAANAASAGYGTTTTSGTVYGSSRYGSYSGGYTSTTTYYDPVAAELSNQRYAQMISNYSTSGKGWLDLLENNLLYSKTLRIGEEYFGLVFSKKGTGPYYRIKFSNPYFEVVSIKYIKEIK